MELANRKEPADGFEFEIEEMRGPDAQKSRWPIWLAPPTGIQPLDRDRRRWQVARAAGVVLILAVALLRLLPSSITHVGVGGTSPQSVDLLAAGDDVGCLVDAAWSPDGTRVAILGYLHADGCPDRQFVPAQITIYTLAPTTVVARIPLDGILARAVHPWPTQASAGPRSGAHPGAYTYPRIRYYDLSWSRDGQSLATRFSFLYPPSKGSNYQTQHAGVMLLDPRGKGAQVIQLGYMESMELVPVWDSEQASQFSLIPATGANTYEHASDAPVLDTAVALRPDGREAASFTDEGTVDLFDTASGRKLASLVPRVSERSFSGRTALLRWSPDGTRLLLASGVLGTLTVWWA
jgi:hypothetical protein